jgi:hypothetical protein
MYTYTYAHIQGLVDLFGGTRDICSVTLRRKGPGGARKQTKKIIIIIIIKLEREEMVETGERERSGTGHASILRRLPTICPLWYIFYIVRITDENTLGTSSANAAVSYAANRLPHSC